MAGPTQLREVFHPRNITAQGQRIQAVWPGFDLAGFLNQVLPPLPGLNFGERINLICQGLHDFLPPDYPQALAILLQALPPALETENLTGQEDNFILWPLTRFVARYGLGDFSRSMAALKEMTQCFSAEADVRPFIQAYPQASLELLATWAQDKNLHVRRLVSEGIRPRLPLCPALPEFKKDPAPVLRLLDLLKQDPALYVRRSVANCLNDIAKDNPTACLQTLEAWNRTKTPEMAWLTRHALRGLVKQGDPRALALLGYHTQPQVAVNQLKLAKSELEIGEFLEFSMSLQSHSSQPQQLVVDYLIHFQKQSGRLSPKVFKLCNLTLSPGARQNLVKRYLLVQRSTRRLHPGLHRLEIQVSGRVWAGVDFLLREKA